MSDIQIVSEQVWRNPDAGERLPYGSVPLGDYEIDPADERLSVESFESSAVRHVRWV